MNYFLGIDPGKSGAFALINDDLSFAEVWLWPKEGVALLADIFDDILEEYEITLAALEKNNAAPRQGASKTFVHGENYGMWQAALAFMRVPHVIVAAKTWQYAAFDSIKRKDDTKLVSIANAKRRFPQANIGKNDGKADALNLALYARKEYRDDS
jgi:hypothetical protein